MTYKRKQSNRDEPKLIVHGFNAGEYAQPKQKKKKPTELKNFYAHQVKEKKRNDVEELRRRFEEDKARVQKMKESRKFNPTV